MLCHYHTQEGQRAALVIEGRKKLKAVMMHDSGLRVVSVPKTEARHMRPLLYKGKPYPMARACRLFRSFAKTHGATKAAMEIVNNAR